MITPSDKADLEEFGMHLASLRAKKGISLRLMGKKGQIDNSKIARIEKGQVNVTITTIFALAKGLGVNPKELFNFRPKSIPKKERNQEGKKSSRRELNDQE